MAKRRGQQAENHDAAGYETDYLDFAEYGDEYGNNICYGDLSMQRLVERGIRDPEWPRCNPKTAEGYDEHFWQAAIPIIKKLMTAMRSKRGSAPAARAGSGGDDEAMHAIMGGTGIGGGV